MILGVAGYEPQSTKNLKEMRRSMNPRNDWLEWQTKMLRADQHKKIEFKEKR